MSNPRTKWLVIGGIGLLAVAAVNDLRRGPPPAQNSSSVQKTAAAARPPVCSTISAESDRALMAIVYKIDGSYMVYVEPDWYGLKIDQKQMLAGYIAQCKLNGAARFLDSRSGKLLARWGSNGYVAGE
jgi:hypothetical protein